MRWTAIIVAAGRGTRFGRPKQFLELAGVPMVGWSIQTFARMDEIGSLVVATEPEAIAPMRELLARLAPGVASCVVAGGATRQASAYEGLTAASGDAEAMLVHDGARPLVRVSDVRAGMREVRERRAALLAAPVVDTVKVVDARSRRVGATLDRRTLWAAQTPQFAMATDLRAAHERARSEGVTVTDDAALLEAIGVEVIAVPSSGENFKVTLPGDIARAEAILQQRAHACHPELVEACPPELVEACPPELVEG